MTNGGGGAYHPKTLGEAPAGDLSIMIQAAKQRRLVLYLGAGVSMSPPASGPTGADVAARLRPVVARFIGTAEEDLAELSLEELSQRVAAEASDRMTELRDLAADAYEFRGIDPNYGHEAAALLLREGLVRLISVNWDCGVERAGARSAIEISSVADTRDSVQLAHRLPLYKVHGCATRPTTLALTGDEVDAPQEWAVGLTKDAVAGGVIVFVGLGTVGLYVREPFEQIAQAWTTDAETLFIVDPNLSDDWKKALGGEAANRHVALKSDEFFDELTRAVVRDALERVGMAARALAEHEGWASEVVKGFEGVREAFDQATAPSVLRWWRDGVIETLAGQPFITELPGQNCLIAVAQLVANDQSDVTVHGVRGRQTVATDKRYLEIVRRPGQHVSQIQKSATERIRRRREEHVYGDGRPVTVVVAEARGQFPAEAAPTDIAASTASPDDIADDTSARIGFVAAEDAVQGRLAA